MLTSADGAQIPASLRDGTGNAGERPARSRHCEPDRQAWPSQVLYRRLVDPRAVPSLPLAWETSQAMADSLR